MQLKELARLYLENYAIPTKKTWKKDAEILKRVVLPEFSERVISKITRLDMISWFNKLSVTTGPVYANRSLEIVRKMFNCAIDWELLKKNPCERIKKNKEQSRTEFVTPDALPRLLHALSESPNASLRAVVLTILFTGLRPGEVLSLRWENVNLADSLLCVKHTKNGREHLLPLTKELRQLLVALPRKGEWVFPGKRENQPLGNIHKAWYAVREAAGLPTLRLHDLRRTVGSYLAMSNFGDGIIGRILNHQSPVSTKIYTRFTLDPLRVALEHQAHLVQQAALLPETDEPPEHTPQRSQAAS